MPIKITILDIIKSFERETPLWTLINNIHLEINCDHQHWSFAHQRWQTSVENLLLILLSVNEIDIILPVKFEVKVNK